MNNPLRQAVLKTSRKLSVDKKLVELVYRSYWGFIKDHISSMTLRDMTQEEFESVDTNFNIPHIGKLYVENDKLERYKRQLKFYQDVKAKKN